jgi:protein-S-isoprenylcysteine O-methyltransferase Ste14
MSYFFSLRLLRP